MFENLPPLSLASNSSKLFIIDSCDQCIANILKQHGWKQVAKTNNQNYHLKWVWKINTKELQCLQTGQFINHFKGSDQITTKLGLSLLYKRNPVITHTGKCYLNFYPRSYNLNTQKEQFIKDYTQTSILNLLKKIVVSLQLFHFTLFQKATKIKNKFMNKQTNQLLHYILQNSRLIITQKNQQNSFRINGRLLLRLLFYLQNIFSLKQHFQFTQQQLKQLTQYSKKQIDFTSNQINSFQYNQIPISPTLQTISLLLIYHKKCLKNITGYYQDGFSNIWVIKSNHSSRGRNITLLDNIQEIQNLDNGMKLIQKYIENIWVLHQVKSQNLLKYPQIMKIFKKKFDIRFWVLVKSFSPLVIYIYDQAYLRISSQSYRLDGLNQKNSHLTNFTINWKPKNKQDQDQSSYLLFSSFLKYLSQELFIDVKKLTKNIHQIILETLKLVDIKEDLRCFQLFGFDVILDAQLNPWILQCNMSPACSPRGQLKQLIKNMSEGLLTIMGFINGNENKWKLLYDDRTKNTKGIISMKQTNKDFNTKRSSTLRTTLMNWNDLLLSSKKVEWRKYEKLQNIQYFIQKVQFIQKCFKQKFSSNQNLQLQQKQRIDYGKALLMIEKLAKFSKKAKKYWLKKLQKIKI